MHCCHLCEPLHTAPHSAAGLNAPHSAAGLNAVACAARGRVQRGHGRPPPCQLSFAHICALMFLLSPSSSSQLHAFVSGLISFFDQSIKPVPTRGWFCLPVAFIGCLLTFAHPSLIPEAHYPSPHLPFPLICTCHHPSPPLTASHMHALSCLRVFIHSPTLPRLSPNSATCSTCCAPPPPPSQAAASRRPPALAVAHGGRTEGEGEGEGVAEEVRGEGLHLAMARRPMMMLMMTPASVRWMTAWHTERPRM